MKHSRVKLFVKADHLTSKADIIHIIFFSSKVMVSIWYQQVLFQSLDFIFFWRYIIQIVEDSCYLSSEVKHATSCNEIIKESESLDDSVPKYKRQNSMHLSKRPLSDVMSSNCFCTVLFPKRTQLFGIRVLVFHPIIVWIMFGKNACHFNIRNNTFFCVNERC